MEGIFPTNPSRVPVLPVQISNNEVYDGGENEIRAAEANREKGTTPDVT